jgi:hypothetical protein
MMRRRTPAPLRGRRPTGARVNSLLLVGTVACALTWAAAGSSATAAARSKAVTVAQAKTHLLVASDMPKGWSTERGTANTQNGSYPAGSNYIACLGAAAGLPEAIPPETDTPYFQNKDGTQEIQESISVFKTSAAAQSSFAALANPAYSACATSALNAYLKSNPPKGGTIGTLTVSPPLGTKFGAHTNGYVVETPITTQGQKVVLTATAVFFLRGTLGQQLTFNEYSTSGSSVAFPPAVIRRMISVAERNL